jgi:FKBP-type peptidyl-prolyl cis-trans isomerase FkpA
MIQKKKLAIGLTLVFTGLLIAACNEKTGKTPQGVEYTVVREGDGRVAKPGEVVVLDVQIVDKKDSSWFDSRIAGLPEMIMIRPDSFKKDEYGVMELFRLVSAGDSLTMTVPARDFFERTWMRPVPPGIDPMSPFTFRIATESVLDSMTAINMRQELYMKQQQKMPEEALAQSSNQLGMDTTMIDEHLAAKNVKPQTTSSGLRYIVKKKGQGPNAVQGQLATVKYKGYLLNGQTFDEGVYTFPVGEQRVIPGWDEIVLLMNKGTQLTVYVPSSLAYGNQRRSEEILENSILAFDMELQDLKNQ